MYFLFPLGFSPRSLGDSEGAGGGEDPKGEEEEEEQRECDETEEERGDTWEKWYSQVELGGLGGEPEPNPLEWNGEEE